MLYRRSVTDYKCSNSDLKPSTCLGCCSSCASITRSLRKDGEFEILHFRPHLEFSGNRSYGFIELPEHPNRLFIPMQTIEELLER